MKVAVGGLTFETNTFVSERVNLASWREIGIYNGEEILNTFQGTNTVLGGFIKASEKLNFQLIPTFYAGLGTGGITTTEAYEYLSNKLIDVVTQSGSDGILLWLHGAMVSESVEDCESDILRKMKESVKNEVPIVVVLDHHANVNKSMIENADVMIGYKTHHDYLERGVEAAKILISILKGKLQPYMAFRKLPMLDGGGGNPEKPPMSKMLFETYEMEKEDEIINASVFPGFPYSDIKRAGMSVIVTTDKNQELAEERAQKLSEFLWSLRKDFIPKLISIEEAIERALTAEAGPIIFSDKGDNALGGAPGDCTAILEALRDSGWPNATLIIRDPESVSQAFKAGEGAKLTLSIGGKIDPNFSGETVSAAGTVVRLSDGVWLSESGEQVRIGRTAVFRCGETDIVLTELVAPQIDPALYRSVGIEPTKKKIVVVKSNWGFRRLYEPIAKDILDVDTPGATPQGVESMRALPWKNIPRPIYPLDDI